MKNRIGRVPYLYDFVSNHSIDPVVIVDHYSNYYQFLLKMKEEVPVLSTYENKALMMLSLELLNGKRKHEMILLDLLLHQGKVKYDDYLTHLTEVNCSINHATIDSVKRILNLSFFTQAYKTKYGEKPIIILHEDQYFMFNEAIRGSLNTMSTSNFWSATLCKVQKKRTESTLATNRLPCTQNIQEKMLVGY